MIRADPLLRASGSWCVRRGSELPPPPAVVRTHRDTRCPGLSPPQRVGPGAGSGSRGPRTGPPPLCVRPGATPSQRRQKRAVPSSPSSGRTVLGGEHVSGDLGGMQLTVARSADLSNPPDVEFFPFPFSLSHSLLVLPEIASQRNFQQPTSCLRLCVRGTATGTAVEQLPMIRA